MRPLLLGLVGLLATLTLPNAAQAQSLTWCVDIHQGEVVPPTGSFATAQGFITLDQATLTVSWWIEHQGLSGTHVATHFHGPAKPGENAGVIKNLGLGNPVQGASLISASQATQLMAGLWYINFHTTVFGSGEIRGQIDDLCGQTLCTALGNSWDPAGARLLPIGRFHLGDNALAFQSLSVPPGQFGYLLIGQGVGIVTPPGTAGQLCLAGAPIGRFAAQVLKSDAAGVLGPFTPDLSALPNPPGGSVLLGETWGFQTWFRDGPTSNFSDAVSLTFSWS